MKKKVRDKWAMTENQRHKVLTRLLSEIAQILKEPTTK